jgi:hypothetical protein
MTTVIYTKTCQVCEATKEALLKFVMGVWSIGESAGRARAAGELARLGYYKEAKKLMLESK